MFLLHHYHRKSMYDVNIGEAIIKKEHIVVDNLYAGTTFDDQFEVRSIHLNFEEIPVEANSNIAAPSALPAKEVTAL